MYRRLDKLAQLILIIVIIIGCKKMKDNKIEREVENTFTKKLAKHPVDTIENLQVIYDRDSLKVLQSIFFRNNEIVINYKELKLRIELVNSYTIDLKEVLNVKRKKDIIIFDFNINPLPSLLYKAKIYLNSQNNTLVTFIGLNNYHIIGWKDSIGGNTTFDKNCIHYISSRATSKKFLIDTSFCNLENTIDKKDSVHLYDDNWIDTYEIKKYILKEENIIQL